MSGAMVHLALGSNLGDRVAMIVAAVRAIDQLTGTQRLRCSRVYETEAVGEAGQSAYLNAAVELITTLPPPVLLERLLEIESSLGRVRDPGKRWHARTIDLDILLVDDVVLEHPQITLPHPRLHERPFVLAPICDLIPDRVHPTIGRTMSELLKEHADSAGAVLNVFMDAPELERRVAAQETAV